MHCDHDDDSDADINGETERDDDSNPDNDPRFDDEMTFDSEDDRSDNGAADVDIDEYSRSDSGYNSDSTDVTMIENTDKCYITEIDEYRELLHQNLDAAKPSEFEEAKREYKALCYKAEPSTIKPRPIIALVENKRASPTLNLTTLLKTFIATLTRRLDAASLFSERKSRKLPTTRS